MQTTNKKTYNTQTRRHRQTKKSVPINKKTTTNKQTNIHTYRQTERETHKQTNKQTNKQTRKHRGHIFFF